MNTEDHAWAMVLAAGSGQRLSQLTVGPDGANVPKQFCSLAGAGTLFEDTLARARRFASPSRIATVVAAEHRRWWQPLTSSLPRANVLEQPRNRGTAVGIMLACLHLVVREPEARVVLLPSDHFVRDEALLGDTIARSLVHLASAPDKVLLIGISPEEPDHELGYVVPGTRIGSGLHAVAEFVEKPSRHDAAALVARGAVWNSFILAARASTLLALCASHCGDALTQMRAALRRDGWAPHGGTGLTRVYDQLADIDFSRQVLARNADVLRVLSAPACGWTDLGTPPRVVRCLEALGARWLGHRATPQVSSVNLVQACAALGQAG